jgi:hypothetical protein
MLLWSVETNDEPFPEPEAERGAICNPVAEELLVAEFDAARITVCSVVIDDEPVASPVAPRARVS